MARDGSEEIATWLVTLPPTPLQRRASFIVAAVLFVGFLVLATFASRPLPRLDAFIPAVEGIVFVTDLITSVLLFAQFSIYRSRALLALASGYLFTALIVVPHALTFPGAFAPTGLLGAGVQSTAWLYVFWHIGFPAALLAYAWLKDGREEKSIMQTSPVPAIGRSAAIVFGLVSGLTWLAIGGNDFLPPIFVDAVHIASLAPFVIAVTALISAIALGALWFTRRSVLDQWLMVVALSSISELIFTALLSNVRFSLGFYAGRILSLVTSTTVLVVLLAETTRLYGRLARSHAMLQLEQDNKLMNLEAMAASISHEVRQPLAAINMSGRAALRFIGLEQPDLKEVRSSLNMIISDSSRASEIFDNLRALFGKSKQSHDPVDLNKVITRSLGILRRDLTDNEITTHINLKPDLPLVAGHEGQLQEVIINLVRNAIEAMNSIQNVPRELKVKTAYQDDKIIVAIEDTGPGIDPKKLEHVFDAFVTTKRRGMGLGLAICRMIVERHAGQLSATPAYPHGVIFRIFLPQMPVQAG